MADPTATKLVPLHPGVLNKTWPSVLSTISAGLYNGANTCFLNSILQCLLHTPPLLHILLEHDIVNPCMCLRYKTWTGSLHVSGRAKPSFCMSCHLKTVMERSQSRRPFKPKRIITALTSRSECIMSVNAVFNLHLVIAKGMASGVQEDAHEFLRCSVDALQQSCVAGLPP